MYKKTLFLSLILFLFVGCLTTSPTISMPDSYYDQNGSFKTIIKGKPTKTGFYTPIISHTRQKTLSATSTKSTKKINYLENGYIKGIVKKIYCLENKKNWIYHIKGLDLSNHKLNYAKAYATKKLAKLNDLVYANIQKGLIVSLYIYKSAQNFQAKRKRRVAKKVSNSSKTRRREQILNAPKAEKVIF